MGAERNVTFPSCFRKSLAFFLVSKRVSRIEGKIRIFSVSIEKKLSFLAHLFCFVTLYCIIKYGNETHP